MKSILKGNSIFLACLLVKMNPFKIAFVLFLKGLFILCHVVAIWVVISWFNGSVVGIATNLTGLPSDSFYYPLLSSGLLIFSSLCAALSRYISLKCTNKLSLRVKQFSTKSKSKITISDYRNLIKSLLSIIDIFVPSFLILVVICLWSYLYPIAIPLCIAVLLAFLYFFRKTVKVSAKTMKIFPSSIAVNDYLGSESDAHFQKILMHSQYVIVAVYSLMAICVSLLAIIIKNNLLISIGEYATLLIIATAISILQLKSFVSALVKMGAYNATISKIVTVLRS